MGPEWFHPWGARVLPWPLFLVFILIGLTFTRGFARKKTHLPCKRLRPEFRYRRLRSRCCQMLLQTHAGSKEPCPHRNEGLRSRLCFVQHRSNLKFRDTNPAETDAARVFRNPFALERWAEPNTRACHSKRFWARNLQASERTPAS